MSIEKNNLFSSNFVSLQVNNKKYRTSGIKNPFYSYINDYSNPDLFSVNFENLQDGLNFQTQLNTSANDSYNWFILELILLEENKTEYLNIIVDYLLVEYDRLRILTSEKTKSALIINSIMNILGKICSSPYQSYLNNNNRKQLSIWFDVNEPIFSFTLKEHPEDKWFEQKFRDLLISKSEKGFISNETSFSTFKALFNGKYLENKINWIDNKASLRYFIRSLISKEVIINPKNKHWEITSEFFFLRGENIKRSELLNKKSTTDKKKRRKIDLFINFLSKNS